MIWGHPHFWKHPVYIYIHMLIRQPPVLPSLRIGISRSSGKHSRYTVWKESNDNGAVAVVSLSWRNPTETTNGWLEWRCCFKWNKCGWNGRCLSPDSCRWWSDPSSQERSGDSRSVIQEGHDHGRFDEIPDLCLVGVGMVWCLMSSGSAVSAMEKMWGIKVSRACDAAGWVEGLRGLQGLVRNQSYRTFGLLSI